MQTIGTHGGVFHADDVLAVAILKRLHPEARIVRSRDPKVLDACDVLVDVGGVYDPEHQKFDHHFKGASVAPEGITFSSAGLVWEAFGLALCGGSPRVATQVRKALVAPVDAIDNGQAGFQAAPGVNHATFSALVSGFNPTWDGPQDFDQAFDEAVDFATGVLDRVIRTAKAEVLASALVEAQVVMAEDPRLVVLDRFVPWVGPIAHCPAVLFVVFPSENHEWRIQTVKQGPGTMKARKDLPETWAGQPPETLNALLGIDDAVFAHPGRFIAGAKSKDSILKMAQAALDT